MTQKEWYKKLEPFAKMLYETFKGVISERAELQEKILRDFGAVEAYVSVANDGVRMLISFTETESISLKFRYSAG